jgi:hypothetical protein
MLTECRKFVLTVLAVTRMVFSRADLIKPNQSLSMQSLIQIKTVSLL